MYGMEYMDKRGCSYQQFKDEADLMRYVMRLELVSTLSFTSNSPIKMQIMLPSFRQAKTIENFRKYQRVADLGTRIRNQVIPW